MICDSPFYVLPKGFFEKIPVPCGRCPPCKLRRVNSWVFRLMEESKNYENAHFITLTYTTKSVPISHNGFMTLDKKDLQNFFKRLRKLQDGKIKYYAVGEYGTNNKRPHYHAIVFNVENVSYYEKAWTLDGDLIGGVHVGNVSGDSIAYTLKYIDKQQFKRSFNRDDRIPEFPLMSKKLGESYINEQTISYHKADLSRLYLTKLGGYRIALPRYYRQKIYDDKEMKMQVNIINDAVNRENIRDETYFYMNDYNPKNPDYNYERHKDSGKAARYKHFYIQKPRDV